MPEVDFIPAPIADDFIPAPIAGAEDFIAAPVSETGEQDFSQSIRSAQSQDEAIQLALPHFNSPDRINLAVDSLAAKKKQDDSRSGSEKLAALGEAMLGAPGVALNLFKHLRNDVLPAIAQSAVDISAPLFVTSTKYDENAGARMPRALTEQIFQEEKKQAALQQVRGELEIESATRTSALEVVDILRNAARKMTVGQAALNTAVPGSKALADLLKLNEPGKTDTDENYRKQAFEDLVAAQSIKEAAEGGFTVGAEESAAAGFPVRPEQVQGLETVTDVTNLLPGFVGAKVGSKAEIAARALRTLNKPAEVGAVRKAVSYGLDTAGKKLVESSDSPVATGLLAGTAAMAAGLDPSGIAIATILGSNSRAANITSSVLSRSGNKLIRLGGKAGGTVALGPLGSAVELTGQFFGPAIREGAKEGLIVSVPFIAGQKDEEGVVNAAATGAAFGAAGAVAGRTVSAAARQFPLDNFFRDRSADRPDTDYVAPEFTHYTEDHSNVLEATSRSIFESLSNKDRQNFEAIKTLVGKPDENGVETRIYAVDRATGDAAVKQLTASTNNPRSQIGAGVTIDPAPGQKVRLVLINADAKNGIAAGHEVGHAVEMSLPAETRKQLYDLVDPKSKKSLVDADDFEGLRGYYEELFNRVRNPDGTFSELPEGQRRRFSNQEVVSEYIAENFSAFLNGVPPGKFGTPRPIVDRVRLALGAFMEKSGARRLYSQGESKLQTELGLKPSFALAQVFQNYLEAGRLDNVRLPGEPPLLVEPPKLAAEVVAAPAPAAAPVKETISNVTPVEEKPAAVGFKKGDPIGDIRNPEGMLVAEAAKVIKNNNDGTYEIEFIDPDSGKTMRGTADEASLQSPVIPGKVPAGKDVFYPSPVTSETASGIARPETLPKTAADIVAPVQVENVARPQATPALRPKAADTFAAKADDKTHLENRKVLEEIMLAPRSKIPVVETDYYSAASPVESPDAQVRAAQRKAADAIEKSGQPNPFRTAFQKLFVPYRWTPYKLSETANARLYGKDAPRQPGGVFGMSVDKVGQNLDLLRGIALENPKVAEVLARSGFDAEYLSGPEIVSDFRKYLENQANGFGGGGERLLRPADTRPGTVTPEKSGVIPNRLSPEKRQLFNLLLNFEQQTSRTAGMEYSARFAKQNGIDPLVVGFDDKGRPLTENNALRASLIRQGFDPRVLNSAVENLPTENFTTPLKVRPDIQFPAADVAITQAGFMPETAPRRPQGNDETRNVAAQYAEKAGIRAKQHDVYAPTDEATLKRIADFYESAKHEPNRPEVEQAYRALAEETRAQYDEMVANGIEIEPYEGKGEPYANSAAMLQDVRDNKHLYFFLTKNAFGEGENAAGNALLEKSGIKINGHDLLYNDLFRAVHDYFGHTAEGFEFGPRGEYNAYLAHSRMFSDVAKPALAAETLAQNAWVNFGPQLRRSDGSLPKSGDVDFVPIAKRRFADQKNTVVPEELLRAADPQASFMPELQLDAEKKLPDAIKEKTLTLVHRGTSGLQEIDPAKFGASKLTPRSELSGEPRSYYYVKGFENKSDPVMGRGTSYEIPVSGKRIYDADADPLDWAAEPNRQRADLMLKDAGYAGLVRTRGKGKDTFKQVELFEKVSTDGSPVSETEVRTPTNRLDTKEGREIAARLRAKYGSTGAYFDRLQEYKDTGTVRYMPEAPDTPEFKNWFGDSKVVDESGKPEVLYHSTTYGDFSEFKKELQAKGMAGFGFYFTDREGSNIYSDMSMRYKADKSFSGEDKKTNVMPVFLKMENPLRAENIDSVYQKYGKGQPGQFGQRRDFVESEQYRFGLPADVKLSIEKAGYDGVIANETVKRNRDGSYSVVEPGTKGGITHPVYVVFEPAQIKSATGNRGTFDPKNPDIRFMPEATPEDFAPDRIKDALTKSGWAIFTAENPDGKPASADKNADLFAGLVSDLEKQGLKYEPVLGKYGGEENSVLVFDPSMSIEKAQEIAQKYRQDAVLVPEGFVYRDGSVLPAVGIETYDTAPADYYSKIGDSFFSVKFGREFGDPLKADSPEVQAMKDRAVSEDRDYTDRIDTRVMTSKKTAVPEKGQQLNITAKEVIENPKKVTVIGNLVKDYPGLPSKGKAADVLAEMHRLSVDNLLWLHDRMPEELRDRSKLWYDGGRKLVEDWSKKYDTPRNAVAGVMAALSPQKDRFMNVDLARRVIELNRSLADKPVTPEIVDWFDAKFGEKAPENLAALKEGLGKPYRDLTVWQKAVFLRAYDEQNNPRSYPVVNPEGTFAETAKNANGNESKVAWGDFGSISKAIGILADPTRANVSARLGQEHKVRNFYNNLLLPNEKKHGDVTIDTHAVAAALLRPLSGSDIPVLHNFGGAGAPSSAITGASGTYGLHADAYREAAAKRGLLPREMQSITWEAVRGLFTPEFKTEKNRRVVDEIWTDYENKKIDANEARNRIEKAAGGIRPPSWSVPGPSGDAPSQAAGDPRGVLADVTERDLQGAAGRRDRGAVASDLSDARVESIAPLAGESITASYMPEKALDGETVSGQKGGMNKTAKHNYELVKFYADGRPPQLVKDKLTEQQAISAANGPSTRKAGEWFIGYREMGDRHKRSPRSGIPSITTALLANRDGLGAGRAEQGLYSY